MSSNGRIGVVVFLKDEVYDVAAWLAWHVSLGFDTIFVFDDGSTDGTDQIVKSASVGFDIRYTKVVPELDEFYQRQQKEYRQVLAASRTEFAWLCFLDSDEYLLLRHDQTVADFLSRYRDAQGIAINWCLYGSSYQTLRPLLPPPAVYMYHSDLHESINRHVKSFVRPDQQEGLYNVHAFRVEPRRYLNTDGQPIEWSNTIGIIQGQPLWDKALIMHFQCRSMEHFLERARRRRDQPSDARAWTNEAWNRRSDHSPDHFFEKMFEILTSIELEHSSNLGRHIGSLSLRPRPQEPTPPAGGISELEVALEPPQVDTAVRFFTLRSHFGTFLCFDESTNLLVHAVLDRGEQGDLKPVFLARSSETNSNALLVRAFETLKPLRVDGSRQAAIVVPLELGVGSAEQITLRTPVTHLFLSAEPPAARDLGRVVANRRTARAWEMFESTSVEASRITFPVRQMSQAYFGLLSNDLTVESMSEWLATHARSTTSPLLQIMLRNLPKSERTRMSSSLAATVAPELLLGSQYS